MQLPRVNKFPIGQKIAQSGHPEHNKDNAMIRKQRNISKYCRWTEEQKRRANTVWSKFQSHLVFPNQSEGSNPTKILVTHIHTYSMGIQNI
jgi:hypothetical protein